MTVTGLDFRHPHPAVAAAHHCPVTTCTRHVRAGQVACREHWIAIPSYLRDPLRDAFRNRLNDRAAFAAAVETATALARTYAQEQP